MKNQAKKAKDIKILTLVTTIVTTYDHDDKQVQTSVPFFLSLSCFLLLAVYNDFVAASQLAALTLVDEVFSHSHFYSPNVLAV
eukprot:m.75381 g.75381  ORF g.75381 m.75381 type:complete len:83 (+) comp12448_c0_seq4:1032-1280(+)